MYIYVRVHAILISKKKGHEFDGEWGGYMRGHRRKGKREMF